MIGFDSFPKGPEWVERANEALKKEWEKLVDLCCFIPKMAAGVRTVGKNILNMLALGEIKLDSKGKYKKTKGRAVVDGSRQMFLIDYVNKSSPTVQLETLRMWLGIACNMGWYIVAGDVENAYVNALLDCFIYGRPPRGVYFLDPELAAAGINSGGVVLEIIKALYGAAQSGRCFYMLIRAKLIFLGFWCSHHDPCQDALKITGN